MSLINFQRMSAAPAMAMMAVIVAIILTVLVSYNIWQEYASTRRFMHDRAASRSLVATTHAEWLVGASMQTLEMIDRMAGDGDLKVSREAAIDLAALVEKLPGKPTAALFDKSGVMVFSTGEKVAPDPQILLAMQEGVAPRRPFISAATSEQAAQSRHLVISRPVLRDGEPAGFASLSIPLDILSDLWSAMQLGPGSTVGLIRDDGWLVARIPPPDKPVNLANYILFTDYLKKSDSGTYDAQSPVDGEDRVVGYRRLRNAPLIAVASVSTAYGMGEFWTHFSWVLGAVAVAIALCGLMAAWVWRLLQRDERLRRDFAAAADRNTQLLREVHHRVKNNLQAVVSLIQLQNMAPETKRDLSSRIAAMSAVHEQAYKSDQYAELDASDYLGTIITYARDSYGESCAIPMDLEKGVIVDRDVALPLGLIANEVIGNAMKHAFGNRADPRIDVKLHWAGTKVAELVVHDNGQGYLPSSDDKGMGSRLIRAFGQQLGGDYSYEKAEGTKFSIRFAAHRDPDVPG